MFENFFAAAGTFLLPGLLTGIGFILILTHFNLLKVAGYAMIIDALFTIALPILTSNTFIGFITAIIAGIVLSIFLFAYRKWNGYATYNFKDKKWHYNVD
jgi:hypothetical protein